MSRSKITILGLVFAVSACTGPLGVPERPSSALAVPDDFRAATGAERVEVARYWEQLGDPLLAQFVEQAIRENRDLAVASARVAQARAGVQQARAGYLPSINASGSGGRNFGNQAPDELSFSLGADARWEIDLFGRVRYDVASARASLAAAGYSQADLQRLIVGQVAQTTVSARTLVEQLAIARDSLANQDENLQIARWRLQAGLVSSLDVEQAAAQRAQTAAQIPALERDLVASANTISTLIGEPPGRVLALLEAEAPAFPSPPEAVGIDAPASVLRRRPDVRSAEAQLLSDTARIGVARAQMLPLVQLTGNVGTSSLGIGNLFDVVTGGLFAGISQLIFDGGRTAAQVDAAEAGAEASLAAWEQSILQALEDVESAEAALRASRQRIALFRDARTAAENAAIIARSQYQAGLIDFRTLLTAEDQLLSARNALSASEAERANAFIRLTQALGGGWDPAEYDFPEGQE